MNGVDYAIIALAAIGAIGGFIKGGIRNLVTVAGICLGVFLGMRYSDELASPLKNLIPNWRYTHMLAFGIILLATTLVLRLAGVYLERLTKGIGLGGVNRLIGACAGALMASLIALGLITAADHLTDRRMKDAIERSRIARQLTPLARRITGIVEKEKIDELKEKLKNHR